MTLGKSAASFSAVAKKEGFLDRLDILECASNSGDNVLTLVNESTTKLGKAEGGFKFFDQRQVQTFVLG